MSFRRALIAGLGAVVLAATVSLGTAAPAAAADPGCYAWRTLQFGDSGKHAIVEPGAPWHVRLGTDANGYHLFEFCDLGLYDGKRRITIEPNGNKDRYLTAQPDRRVTADGGLPVSRDNWFLCALDDNWAEVSFFLNSSYLGVNSYGYLNTTNDIPNGGTLWRLSQFSDFDVPRCRTGA